MSARRAPRRTFRFFGRAACDLAERGSVGPAVAELDPRYSAHWLERARDSLSDRAYLARSAYLAPLIDDNRWSALAKVLVALRSRSISSRICLLLSARCLSAKLYRSIIRVLDKSDIFPSQRRGTP